MSRRDPSATNTEGRKRSRAASPTDGRRQSPSSRAATKQQRRAKQRRGKRRGPGRCVWLAMFGASATTVLVVGIAGLWMWGHQPETGTGFTAFEVRQGQSLSELSERLHDVGLTDSPSWFSWYKRAFASTAVLEPGQHWLRRGQSPHVLIQALARRRGRGSVRVNLPEGWDSFQIAGRLADTGVCDDTAFLAAVHDASRARTALGSDSFEGYLYPATYEFGLNSEPQTVIARMVQEARTRFRVALEGAGSRRELTDHEIVVLASIVQKEAAATDEMPTIASVFFNRLEDPSFRPRRMLQSDPTAAYGCKRSGAPRSCASDPGQVTPAMLRDPANPYNTYKHPGLPPGPIGNPSDVAIGAVLRAPPSSYYFFVLGADGRHRFSRSLDEHRRAIGNRAP